MTDAREHVKWPRNRYTQPGGQLRDLDSANCIEKQAAEIDRLKVDARRWKMLAHMNVLNADSGTLAYYISNPDKLDYVAYLQDKFGDEHKVHI